MNDLALAVLRRILTECRYVDFDPTNDELTLDGEIGIEPEERALVASLIAGDPNGWEAK